MNGAAMNEQALRKALERFGSKPDDALESTKVSAAFLSCSERTLRYHPAAERVYITADRYNYRVGNIREIARNGFKGATVPKAERRESGGESWKKLGDVATRVAESCGADIRDHSIKMQRELNRRKGG